MKNKIITTIILGIFLISFVCAEQLTFDDDNPIIIYDSWKDIDGTPLTSATCTWFLYNQDGSINSNGVHTEINPGNFNINISQKPIGIYPFLLNCSKLGYNGTSTISSIKIVDELTEDFKDNLIELNTTTKEINQTTHDIKDFLLNDLNNTIDQILSITTLNQANLTNISNTLDIILENQDETYDFLVQKWGSDTAEKIIDKIDDVETTVQELEFRMGFVSNADLSGTLSILKRDTNELKDLMYEEPKDFSKWIFPSILVLFVILIIILGITRKKQKKFPMNVGRIQ